MSTSSSAQTASATASDSSNAMAASSAIGGFSSLASAYSQSQAMGAQAAFQAQQNETNARLAERQAGDAIDRGDRTAEEIAKQGGKIEGSQRAALAAQGVVVDSGSAGEVTAETRDLVAKDIRTAKSNAWREAWGYKVQANNARGTGRMMEIAGNANAQSTILTGGLQAISSGTRAYSEFKKG